MKYEIENERVGMMNSNSQVVKTLALVEDPQIQRYRKILLIILGIFLTLWLINTTIGIVNIAHNPKESVSVIASLISMLISGLGFWATYKYNATGLRVFAWLGVIGLVCGGILLGVILILAFDGLVMTGVAIIIVHYSFKLARLIVAKKAIYPRSI
ncbi:unnamed protein product [Rotaria sp. Silwood1]|nr:unnamed protein product [Rotaria sp. Silwood1]CAF1634575.1 unnamed protein product [Rotaria sp. Silwood1]